jgi:hypothetical protein
MFPFEREYFSQRREISSMNVKKMYQSRNRLKEKIFTKKRDFHDE